MSKTTGIILPCVVIAALALLYQWAPSNKTDFPRPDSKTRTVNKSAPDRDIPVSPEPAPKSSDIQEITKEETPFLPALSPDRLMGTSWRQGRITMRFLDDGRWEMNGRICAQWLIEGDRIKVYNDDLNEVHYIDIVDGTLSFNGEKIAQVD